MAIKLLVAITDKDWFSHLRQRPDLVEVNFWSPSPRNLKALRRGELLLFKLHSPHNYIVGGGVFAHTTIMPCSLAWETFGEMNGASSLDEMRRRIARYNDVDLGTQREFEIGCRILTQPFFLSEDDWIPVAQDAPRNYGPVKSYTTDNEYGRQVWEQVNERANFGQHHRMAEQRARFGEPYLYRPRLGQGTFRIMVTDIYRRRCAVTRERVLPALEAAHIRPFSEGGEHEPNNGLLLRRDIHSLFDAGYVTVTTDLRFEVSRSIKEEFDNGKIYYALHGQSIERPRNPAFRPHAAALAWHNERFRG